MQESNQTPNQNLQSVLDDQVPERRSFKLRSVETETKIHTRFAEEFGFVDGHGNAQVDQSLDVLKKSFFRSELQNGREITNYHLTLVITVALQTNLNPFINDLYGLWTSFGELKVFATIEGWNKIATMEAITKRDFIYSEDEVTVDVQGVEYQVPKWIECTVEHKEKGVSKAREYFLEVYNNSQQHLPTWFRPARALANVTFIQSLRRMLNINCLATNDMITDMTREYEMYTAKATADDAAKQAQSQQSSGKTTITQPFTPKANEVRRLNIALDDIEVIDAQPPVVEQGQEQNKEAEVSQAATTQVKPDANVDSNTKDEANVEVETVNASPEPTSKPEPITIFANKPTPALESNTPAQVEPQSIPVIEEVMVSRTVLQLMKPAIEQCKKGSLPLAKLIARRAMISDPVAQRWFDQEIERLR